MIHVLLFWIDFITITFEERKTLKTKFSENMNNLKDQSFVHVKHEKKIQDSRFYTMYTNYLLFFSNFINPTLSFLITFCKEQL